MELTKRKAIRLQHYDYSSAGAYFVTICTEKHKYILWKNVGANCVRPNDFTLSGYGEIVNKNIEKLSTVYENIFVEKYAVMPNHIHMIIIISADENGRTQFAPTLSRVIKQFKGTVTKEIGVSIWQKGFYEHIIRNKNDYEKIWEYIDSNPRKWKEDKLFVE